MPARVVIIGGGQAGYQTAASLRSGGFDGSITIVGDEPGLPYQRPPLSKAYLLGKQDAHHLALRPESFYNTNRIELVVDRAVSIDRDQRCVTLASGARLAYDVLVLATGARNRLLPVSGSTLDHVYYLRTLAEAAAIRERLKDAQSIAVIGGGFIGLEVAAVARATGKPVTVIEALPRLMARVVAPPISDYFQKTHSDQGVEVRLDSCVESITGESVRLAGGQAIAADVVIVGIGVVPNVELARDAGLPVNNGIWTDEFLRTADERIFAIGDCAEFPSLFTGSRVRLESVQNAADQAVCVAKAICGQPEHYGSAPWFWTEQFDIRMQMGGLAPQWDQLVVRGDPAARKFSVFYFHEGRFLAADSINRPADHLAVRKLVAARAHITPEQAADEGVDLKKLA